MIDLKELIDLIPPILKHIAPGYVFFSIIQHQVGNRVEEYSHKLFNSAIVSFIINSIISLIVPIDNEWFPIIAIATGILTAFLFIIAVEESWLRNITTWLNLYKSAKNDLISDIVDSKLGMWLYVYINSERVIYLGKLIKYEDKTEDGHRYILLSEYSCYNYEGEEIISNDGDCTKCVLINIANIDRIEVVYNKNSKKIQRHIR